MNYMTTQEVFDKVYKHLLTQNKKSIIVDAKGDFCAYRGVGGTMCAAGCLILDEHYTPELENKLVNSSEVKSALFSSGVPTDCLDMVSRLQTIHDCNLPENWKGELDQFASEHYLSVPVISGE